MTNPNDIVTFPDGIVVLGDATDIDTVTYVRDKVSCVGLIVADPPYGNIVNETWDRIDKDDSQFAEWMVDWTRKWSDGILLDNAAFYVWGGIGMPGFRPFIRYMAMVEQKGTFELANLITWKKRRAYGVQHNYIFTREECAYFTKGNAKKPRVFHVPLLDEKRGYAGYDERYPAKSEYYRRSNVWTDIGELMRGKVHPTEKAQKLYEVMINTHTNPDEYVIDLFAGSGVAALAARETGRRFVVVEQDKGYFDLICERLKV